MYAYMMCQNYNIWELYRVGPPLTWQVQQHDVTSITQMVGNSLEQFFVASWYSVKIDLFTKSHKYSIGLASGEGGGHTIRQKCSEYFSNHFWLTWTRFHAGIICQCRDIWYKNEARKVSSSQSRDWVFSCHDEIAMRLLAWNVLWDSGTL